MIVVGKSGRVHAFGRDGRHITSLQLAGDELARRVQRKRYVPFRTEEVRAFREAGLRFLATGGEGQEGRGEGEMARDA